MSPWLSNRVRDDGVNHRADMMFNAWQISHLHLGPFFTAPDEVRRTGPLLFAYVDNAEAVMLKVVPHGTWTDLDVLRQLLVTRPEIMQRWELHGVTGWTPNDEQLASLRSTGTNTALAIEGRTFMPALGTTSSGHPFRIVHHTDHFALTLNQLRHDLRTNSISRATRSRLMFPIGVPVQLRVRLAANGDLVVYDAVRSWAFFSEAAPA